MLLNVIFDLRFSRDKVIVWIAIFLNNLTSNRVDWIEVKIEATRKEMLKMIDCRVRREEIIHIKFFLYIELLEKA